MYIESLDYKSVWELGFAIQSSRDSDFLSDDIKLNIQRMASAIFRNDLSARGRYLAILGDDSIFTTLIQFKHLIKLSRCIHKGQFDKNYLSKIYIRRSNFIAWCEKEYIEPPSDWKNESHRPQVTAYDSSDDENEGWYSELTDRRKKRVACLELAKKIWEEHPEWSYEQVYNDAAMKRFGNPNVFSFDTFKKWARPFSSDQAKEGGRPVKNKQL